MKEENIRDKFKEREEREVGTGGAEDSERQIHR